MPEGRENGRNGRAWITAEIKESICAPLIKNVESLHFFNDARGNVCYDIAVRVPEQASDGYIYVFGRTGLCGIENLEDER